MQRMHKKQQCLPACTPWVCGPNQEHIRTHLRWLVEIGCLLAHREQHRHVQIVAKACAAAGQVCRGLGIPRGSQSSQVVRIIQHMLKLLLCNSYQVQKQWGAYGLAGAWKVHACMTGARDAAAACSGCVELGPNSRLTCKRGRALLHCGAGAGQAREVGKLGTVGWAVRVAHRGCRRQWGMEVGCFDLHLCSLP